MTDFEQEMMTDGVFRTLQQLFLGLRKQKE